MVVCKAEGEEIIQALEKGQNRVSLRHQWGKPRAKDRRWLGEERRVSAQPGNQR